MNIGIYMIENVINKKVYIGQSSNVPKREFAHWNTLSRGKHKNRHLQNSYYKYGPDAFVFSVILFCESQELTHYEQTLINIRKPEYNICRECVNSVLGIKRSQETKDKISATLMGHIQPPEARAKMGRKGRKMSPEVLAKISAANKGRKHTPESIAKMSAYQKAHPSRSMSGRTHSAETKAKMSVSAKKRKQNQKVV